MMSGIKKAYQIAALLALLHLLLLGGGLAYLAGTGRLTGLNRRMTVT